MEIDIRDDTQEEEVTKIYFHDARWLSYEGLVWMEDKGVMMCVGSEEDIDNLIKALQKAKEIWF